MATAKWRTEQPRKWQQQNGGPNSHGNGTSKMVDRTDTEMATAKWRIEQTRKWRQQNGGPKSHGSSDSKMADRTATEVATAKWRTEEDEYLAPATVGTEQVRLPARLGPSPAKHPPPHHTPTHTFSPPHHPTCCQHCAM